MNKKRILFFTFLIFGFIFFPKNVFAYDLRFYGSSDNLCASRLGVGKNEQVTYTGDGACSTIKKINIVDPNYNLQSGVKYNLYTSILLDISRSTCSESNFHIRSDSYIGNYERNQWNGPPTVTWNKYNDITTGINGSCRYNWGYVQQWNSTITSTGMSFDFYFENNYYAPLKAIKITRFELENVSQGGGNTSDVTNAVNNQTNAIINNNNSNTQNIINNNNEHFNNLLDPDTTSSGQLANHYFGNVQLATHGLTQIITAPIRLFQSFIGATCTTLTFPLPFVEQNVSLPCMSAIYQQHFSTFLYIYRLITDGIIAYWVCVKVWQKCKAFLDPTDDKVEVFDL